MFNLTLKLSEKNAVRFGGVHMLFVCVCHENHVDKNIGLWTFGTKVLKFNKTHTRFSNKINPTFLYECIVIFKQLLI